MASHQHYNNMFNETTVFEGLLYKSHSFPISIHVFKEQASLFLVHPFPSWYLPLGYSKTLGYASLSLPVILVTTCD